MNTNNPARRNALKILFSGSAVLALGGCEALQSLPRNHSAGSTTDGSVLAMRVRDALRNHPETLLLKLDISSVEDEVILKGFVNSEIDLQNIDLIANQVEGVRHALIDVYVRR